MKTKQSIQYKQLTQERNFDEQEIIKQKLLTPIYNGCNDDFYLLWKNKHDQYSEVCFWKKYNNNKI
nr:hypothetical protein [uncultured Mediterranean phage uvMED]